MATGNQKRIGAPLGVLRKGLRPVVEREFSHAYGPECLLAAVSEHPRPPRR